MPRLLLICLFLFSLSLYTAFAQPKTGQARLDSLLAELPRAKPDTNRVNLLKDICIAYYDYGNSISNESISYANQALTLARQLMWKKGMVVAYKILGNIYAVKSDNPPALTAYLSGLKIAEEIKDKSQIAGITGNIGYVYSNLANYPQALAYYKKALKVHEEVGNKSSVVLWLILIGEVYSEQGEYAKALDYQLKSLKINEAIGFRGIEGKESNFNNVGLAYLNLADYPKALTYLQNGLKLSKAKGAKQVLVRSYNNLSKLYLKIATNSNATFLTTLLRSNKTSTLQKANAYADSAVVLAKERGDLPYLYRAYQTRSQIQDALGEPQAAFASFKDFIKTKELIINQQNTSNIAAATLQYEFDKKETALRYEQQLSAVQLQNQKQQRTYLLGGIGLLLALLGFIVYGYTQKQKANTVLQQQKEEINTQRTKAENALTELRDTQIQLIQKEKLASLGELTAGIAHEIQNPLNFVNNFSEVSTELVDELKDGPFQQLPDSEKEYAEEILGDLTQNLKKITHHGSRASAIVRGMLEHSRSSTGEKRPTNLNALADEYLKIAYHGLRAKDKEFNAELKTDFGPDLGLIEMAPQEIGRVLLNLYNNAFYAVNEKQKTAPPDYKPTVTVSTRLVPHSPERASSLAHPTGVTTRTNGLIEIRVRDNGTGIPESVKAKIFQPFFTTKPTGEGTGLGLSLSYDVVTKGHGGTLSVESQEGEGTTFVIQLPALS
jgi:two-component system NtrC family sensor kinase